LTSPTAEAEPIPEADPTDAAVELPTAEADPAPDDDPGDAALLADAADADPDPLMDPDAGFSPVPDAEADPDPVEDPEDAAVLDPAPHAVGILDYTRRKHAEDAEPSQDGAGDDGAAHGAGGKRVDFGRSKGVDVPVHRNRAAVGVVQEGGRLQASRAGHIGHRIKPILHRRLSGPPADVLPGVEVDPHADGQRVATALHALGEFVRQVDSPCPFGPERQGGGVISHAHLSPTVTRPVTERTKNPEGGPGAG
jgi:hypothetical protein